MVFSTNLAKLCQVCPSGLVIFIRPEQLPEYLTNSVNMNNIGLDINYFNMFVIILIIFRIVRNLLANLRVNEQVRKQGEILG